MISMLKSDLRVHVVVLSYLLSSAALTAGAEAGGEAAAMNRKRRASGPEIQAWKQAEGYVATGRRSDPTMVEAECATLFRPTLTE